MLKPKNPKAKNKHKDKSAKPKINTWPLYIIIFLLFIFYIFFQHNPLLSLLLGIILFALIVILVAMEIINIASEKKQNLKKDLIQIIIAIIIIIVFFIAIKILLHTNNPLNIVPSCSMLPILHRGDLVVISGNIKNLKAPIINISSNTYSTFIKNFTSNNINECVSYNYSTHSVTQFFNQGDSILLLQFNTTSHTYSFKSQNNSLIKYNCGIRTIKYFNGTTEQVAYTTSIEIENKTITTDANNSIIVYKTIPNDSFYKMGDTFIVHRIFAILNVSGNYYYLTKGDNNPALDLQYGNYPSNSSLIEGKVIAVIPYLGYLKLVLSNNIEESYGCNLFYFIR